MLANYEQPTSKPINPEMLTLARESRGLTQSELSQLSGVRQYTISRYEGDLAEVKERDLAKLAAALEYPPSFFYQTGKRYGPGSSGLYHRVYQSLPASHLKRLHSRLNLLRLHAERLLEGVDIEADYNFPQYEVEDYDGDIEHIATLVRAAWNLPLGPIANVITAIENAGGVVYNFPFGTAKADAIVQWLPPLPPIFLVNSERPGDRVRFSLAHEIGHLVMHAVPHKDIEEEADKFAGAFLMPAKEVLPDLNPVTLPHLAQLKTKWKVAISALLVRAHELNKITDMQYRDLYIKLGKAGARLSEPNTIPVEEPTLLKEIVEVYVQELGHGVSDLAQLLGLHEDELRRLYMGRKFRVVDPLRRFIGREAG